ncbi:hypothetical protein [Sulfitobacter sp. PS-8MA]|uniref:hypothetical protein n=1 Tax=Sulfitobacter sp. PS-8MA TaxID=3237707 RepID=UPI0034C655F0
MTYENSWTTNDIEHALIEWAEAEGERETCPPCLSNWTLDEEQLETIRDACGAPHAAATLANAMQCITDEEGLATIAEILRYH